MGVINSGETINAQSNSSHPRVDASGIAFAVAGAVAFGTMPILAKFAYRAGASPLPLLAARFLITSLVLLGFRRLLRNRKSVDRKRMPLLIALGAFGYAFESSLFFLALEHAPAAVVALVFYSYPLWTTLLSLLARIEPFRPLVLAALVLGTGGVTLIFSAPIAGLVGPLLALGAAIAVAIYLVLVQALIKDVSALEAATWTASGAAVALLVVAAVAGDALPAGALPYAVGLGLATAFAFAALYAAIARIGSSRAAVANMVEPVTTVILASLILSEDITVRLILGTVLIVSALPVLAAAGRRAAPAPEVP